MPAKKDAPEPLTGFLIPDFDDISKEWQSKIDAALAVLAAESAAWQAKVDNLTLLLEGLLSELRAIQGVTVTINRAT